MNTGPRLTERQRPQVRQRDPSIEVRTTPNRLLPPIVNSPYKSGLRFSKDRRSDDNVPRPSSLTEQVLFFLEGGESVYPPITPCTCYKEFVDNLHVITFEFTIVFYHHPPSPTSFWSRTCIFSLLL